MNTNIKNISIKNYLFDRGIHPSKNFQSYGMYLSPFRDERTPSFKVDYNQNLWYDFGTGEGGSIIDLVMRVEECSVGEAMKRLQDGSAFSFHRNESLKFQQLAQADATVSPMQITSTMPLQDHRLLDYLRNKRCINLDIAKLYCREIHFRCREKLYVAVGFQSNGGGFELRNEYFKGGTSPKGITTIFNSSETCLMFEGFMDMLSYLTLKNVARPSVDMVVLNSVVNLSRASEFLKHHQTIHCFLDNDEAGKRALEAVLKLGVEVIDQSGFYREYKDLNAYLVSRKRDMKITEPTSSQGNKPDPKPENQDEKPAPNPPQRRMKF